VAVGEGVLITCSNVVAGLSVPSESAIIAFPVFDTLSVINGLVNGSDTLNNNKKHMNTNVACLHTTLNIEVSKERNDILYNYPKLIKYVAIKVPVIKVVGQRLFV